MSNPLLNSEILYPEANPPEMSLPIAWVAQAMFSAQDDGTRTKYIGLGQPLPSILPK